MKSEITPRGTDRAKIIQVIETQTLAGRGIPEDPARVRTQYWSFDGVILGDSEETTHLHEENIKLKDDAERWRELMKKVGAAGLTVADLFKMVEGEGK